jgi:hypothetical protein
MGFRAGGGNGSLADLQPSMLPAFLTGWKTAFYSGAGVAAGGALLTFLRESGRNQEPELRRQKSEVSR